SFDQLGFSTNLLLHPIPLNPGRKLERTSGGPFYRLHIIEHMFDSQGIKLFVLQVRSGPVLGERPTTTSHRRH
ncbi:MAG: hypothetical protein ACR2MC_06480, partial [Actinomycetota bacterium]